MILQAIHIDKRHRPTLVYSARTPDEFAYLDELHALQDAGKLTLILTLTGDANDWTHARGRAGREHLAGLIERDTLCFVCGPPSMVADIPPSAYPSASRAIGFAPSAGSEVRGPTIERYFTSFFSSTTITSIGSVPRLRSPCC